MREILTVKEVTKRVELLVSVNREYRPKARLASMAMKRTTIVIVYHISAPNLMVLFFRSLKLS